MTISKGKCQVLDVGWNRLGQPFSVANCLESSFLERDLGILVDLRLNMWQQYAAMAKTNRVLGSIHKSIASRSEEVILLFYSTLRKPQLECCVQSGVAQFKKFIDNLEQHQQRVTRMARGQEHMMLEDRQSEMGSASPMIWLDFMI